MLLIDKIELRKLRPSLKNCGFGDSKPKLPGQHRPSQAREAAAREQEEATAPISGNLKGPLPAVQNRTPAVTTRQSTAQKHHPS